MAVLRAKQKEVEAIEAQLAKMLDDLKVCTITIKFMPFKICPTKVLTDFSDYCPLLGLTIRRNNQFCIHIHNSITFLLRSR